MYVFVNFAGKAHLDDRGHDLTEGVRYADRSVVFKLFGVTFLKDGGHVGQHYVVWELLFCPANI